jgi:hypothetical protein
MRRATRWTCAAGAALIASGLLVEPGLSGAAPGGPAAFYTVTPCRAVDSRQPAQGPALASGVERVYRLSGSCGIPAEATAVAFTVVVAEAGAAGNLRMHAAGETVVVPVVNFVAGVTRTSNGVVRLSPAGEVALTPQLVAAATVHVIVDVSGYFVDDTPPSAVADSARVSEDSPAVAIDVLANDTDPDGGPIAVGAVTQPAHGTVAITGGGAGLSYAPAPDYCNAPPATALDTFTYTLTPGTSTATVTVTVDCVDDAPVLAGAGTAAFAEGGGPVPVAPALLVTDVDDTHLESATVTLVNLLDAGAETLAAATGGTAITAAYAAPTLTLTGTDTLASYQAVLRSVTYDNGSSDPSPTARTVGFVVNDGELSSAALGATVTVAPVNDAPVVTAGGGSSTFTEDGPAVTVDPGLTVTDADDTTLASATVTITNLTDAGRETLAATTAGTTLVASWVAPTLTLSGSDTVASYQAVLRTVTYVNTSQDPDPTSRVVAFAALDADGAGAPATTSVVVTPVNDAPVATAGGGSPTFTEDGAAVAVDPAFTVTDADDATLASATVTITNLTDAGSETLAATTAGTAIAAVWSAPTLTLTGADTVASYQAVLRGVRYANASQDPSTAARSILFRASDASAAGNAVTTLVGVVAVNDPPVLAGAGSVTFTEGDGPLAVAPALLLSDADDATLASATVTITNLLDAGAETLLADTTGTSIGAAWAAPTLSLSGADTVAAYQAVLRTVAYRNSSLNPAPTTRSVAFSASDGTGAGAAVATVDVVSVNSPPVLGTNPVTYATAGNTQLHVAGGTLAGVASVSDAQSVLAKAGAVDPDGPAALSVVAASGATTGGGQFAIDALGSFTYVPGAGFTGSDSFTYGLTDGVVTVDGTVNVAVGAPVWYVRDVVDAQNPAGGDGRSTDAFETLAAAQAASGDGHVLFVFAGDTATTPLDGGIVLRNGQKLLGEGAGLTLPPYGSIVPAGEKPRIVAAAGDAVSVPATAGARVGVEVRGLDLQAAGNAVDVTATGANPVGVIVAGNTVRGAGLEGVDLNAGAAAAFTAVVQGNTIAAAANGLDARSGPGATLTLDSSGNTIAALGSGLVVDGSAGGTVVVNGFLGNAVSGTAAGTGILVVSAIFDAAPGGSLQPVPGGITAIGSAADGVGAAGLVLANVAGAVDFADLDVFADGGAALQVSGAGAFTGAAGTQLAVADGVATLRATGGPVVDVGNATLRLVAAGLTSTGSPTTGVSLVNVSDGSVEARLGAHASSSISGAVGTAFNVTGGNAGIAFAGSIVNTTGRAVAIASWAGDDAADDLELTGPIDERGTGLSVTGCSGPRAIAFGGALSIRPVSGSVGLSASSNTNAGGLRATGTPSLIETTNAAALSVTSTTIGGGGLSFLRLSANGGTNGVVLDGTGALGGLTVSGSGAAGTGGIIQNMTGDGLSLRSTKAVSLAWMSIKDNDGSGVYGDDVDGFSISDSTVTGNGDTAAGAEAGLRFQELLGTAAITNTVVSGSSEDNVRLTPASGVLSSLVVTGSTIGPNSPLTGGNGLALIGGGSASTTLVVTGTLFQGNRGAALVGSFGGTGVHSVAVTGSTLRDNGRGVSLATSGAAALDFDVTSNLEIVRTASSAIEVLSAADTPSSTAVTGSIAGNVVGNAAADSGSRDAYGIAVDLRGDERAVVAVTGNDVRHTDLTGLLVTDADFGVIGGPPSDTDVTVRDNAVRDVDDNSGFPCGAPWGTRVDLRHTTQGCLDMAGNQSAQSPAACPESAHFRVRQRDTSTVLFERLNDGDATPSELLASVPVVEAHVVAQNDAGSTANVLLATGFTEAPSGVCAKP